MTTRGVNVTRESRTQQQRDAQPMHEGRPLTDEEIESALGASSILPDIPPRPGMAQRWVRYKRGAEDDPQNLAKMSQRFWTPRDPSTVPKHFQYLVSQREGLGGVIATSDVILMERDERIQARAERIRQDRTNSRTQAVKQTIFSDYEKEIGRNSGFTPPTDLSTARVERGNPVENSSDD